MAFTPNVQIVIDSISKLSDADRLDINKVIFTELQQGSSITRYHAINAGVTSATPIPFGDRGENWEFMKDASGLASNCDDLPCDTGIVLSAKTWNPAYYKCTLEYCVKDLDYKMKDYFNSERWLDGSDEGTFYSSFLRDLIEQQIINSHWTKTYFAANSSANVALSGHDGLFVQYAAVAPAAGAQRIIIAENANATYDAQKLGATTGFDTFSAMVELYEDSRELRTRTDVKIKTTRALALNYLRWLRNEKTVICCEKDPQSATYNLASLSMFGMPIEIVDEWDMIINSIADFNDGTRNVDPHRAVLTYSANEPIGTGDAGKLSKLDLKYFDYEEKTKFVAEYTFDVKLLRDEHFILAM